MLKNELVCLDTCVSFIFKLRNNRTKEENEKANSVMIDVIMSIVDDIYFHPTYEHVALISRLL